MIPLFDPQAVRAADARAIAAGTSATELMDRAGRHLAAAVRDAAHAVGRGLYGLPVALLCGSGNNGGDGFAAARHLAARGADPTVWLVAGTPGSSPEAAEHLQRWRAQPGRVRNGHPSPGDGAPAVIVDCMLATGARGAPRKAYAEAIAAANATFALRIACDVPSGVDAATGAVEDAAFAADVTIALGAHKTGLWLHPGRASAGHIRLGALGIPDPVEPPAAYGLTATGVRMSLAPERPGLDKRSRGVVVILAGSPGMAGAAVLTASGALRAGAGHVTVASLGSAADTVAGRLPDVLTLRLDPDDPDAAFDTLARRVEDADALAIGPGLGHDDRASALVRRSVRELAVPLVLDADGLNAFRHDGDALREHRAPLLAATPHVRELARLLGREVDAVAADRLSVARAQAAAWNAVVVAKGPATVIAAADGRAWIDAAATSALAHAGTGDVLTGVTAALVAGRPEPDAVAAAVWIHGRAGALAAERGTARSVRATDVAAAIPAALREVDPT